MEIIHLSLNLTKMYLILNFNQTLKEFYQILKQI